MTLDIIVFLRRMNAEQQKTILAFQAENAKLREALLSVLDGGMDITEAVTLADEHTRLIIVEVDHHHITDARAALAETEPKK